MKSVFIHLSTVVVCFIFLISPAIADVTYTPVTHSELQEVFDDGTSYWASIHSELYPVVLAGVVINNPEDMSDYTNYSSYVEWQTYIQALPAGEYGDYTVAAGDYGGTALYMRAALPWLGITLYDAEQWDAELDRMLTNSDTLQYGDIVVVQAKAPGMFFRGKYNVNEMHNSDPAYDFTITVIDQTTPAIATITLADLKDTDDDFIFDDTRATGCEHYQASLVHLDNLLLVDAGDWVLDGTVEVKQGDLTFDMKLGLDDDIDLIDAELLETTPFSVTAILDQEDYDAPYTGGYRLWLTSASNLNVVPEPGSLALLVAGGLAALLLWRRRS